MHTYINKLCRIFIYMANFNNTHVYCNFLRFFYEAKNN